MDCRNMCSRAIAYLTSPGREGVPIVTLRTADAPVLTDLGNGLFVGYVVDRGESFRYIQRRHLWAAGMTQGELHRTAVANLATMLKERSALVFAEGEAFSVSFEGNFEASLILVNDLWDKELACYAPSGFLAAFPTKNVLAFCDMKAPMGARQLRRIMKEAGPSDRPITTTLFCREPTRLGWRPYLTHHLDLN